MTDARKLIAEAREKTEKATKGPWKGRYNHTRVYKANGKELWPALEDVSPLSAWYPQAQNDAAFIIAARTLVPALADLAEKALIVAEVAKLHIMNAHGPEHLPDGCSTCALRASLKVLEEK